MTQMEMFDGPDVSTQDTVRLTSQLDRVRNLMLDGQWRTLAEIALVAGGSEAGVSARLRDLRKFRHGSHIVVRERVSGGLWQYKMDT